MSTPWVLGLLAALPDDAIQEIVGDLDIEVMRPESPTPEAVSAVMRRAELVLSGLGPLRPTNEDVRSAPRFAFLQKLGSGLDDYDLSVYDDSQIPLANLPGSTGPAIAEWCLGVAIALTRRLLVVDAAVKSGQWPHQQMRQLGARELSALRVGIVGMGGIGAHAARLFGAVGCEVAYHSRRRHTDLESALDLSYQPFEDLCRTSDVLVVAVPLSVETNGMISRSALQSMPAGSFVINATRGQLIDEAALIELLVDGHLGGAGLDVFHHEPLESDSILRRLPNILLFPHSAADSPQTRERLYRLTHENLRRAVTGVPVESVANAAPSLVRRRVRPASEGSA